MGLITKIKGRIYYLNCKCSELDWAGKVKANLDTFTIEHWLRRVRSFKKLIEVKRWNYKLDKYHILKLSNLIEKLYW